MAATLKEMAIEKHNNDIKHLENLRKNKGKTAAVFNLKEKVVGKKKVQQERVVIKDPESGKELYSPSEIKDASLKYLVKLLTKNTYKENYMNEKLRKEKLHWEHMNETIKNNIDELTIDNYEKTLINIAKNPGDK